MLIMKRSQTYKDALWNIFFLAAILVIFGCCAYVSECNNRNKIFGDQEFIDHYVPCPYREMRDGKIYQII